MSEVLKDRVTVQREGDSLRLRLRPLFPLNGCKLVHLARKSRPGLRDCHKDRCTSYRDGGVAAKLGVAVSLFSALLRGHDRLS